MDNQRKKVPIDETDTDAVISCHGTIFHVHSAILSFESEFFRAAFEGPFKVSCFYLQHINFIMLTLGLGSI